MAISLLLRASIARSDNFRVADHPEMTLVCVDVCAFLGDNSQTRLLARVDENSSRLIRSDSHHFLQHQLCNVGNLVGDSRAQVDAKLLESSDGDRKQHDVYGMV